MGQQKKRRKKEQASIGWLLLNSMPVRLWAVFCPGELFTLVFVCTLLVSAHHEGRGGEEQEDGGEAGCRAHRSMYEAALLPRRSFPQQGKFHHMWRVIFPAASQQRSVWIACRYGSSHVMRHFSSCIAAAVQDFDLLCRMWVMWWATNVQASCRSTK